MHLKQSENKGKTIRTPSGILGRTPNHLTYMEQVLDRKRGGGVGTGRTVEELR